MKRYLPIVVLCVLTSAVFAQTSTSQITGTVYDAAGAVIPGAQVTAINDETGVTYRQQTTGSGLYAFPSLPVGKYTIIADVKGFKTTRVSGNILTVDTPLTVDINLEAGGAAEVINVIGIAEKLQTSNATLGNEVDVHGERSVHRQYVPAHPS